ncbi:hypothetical protein GR925_05930 [Streptomyces sp. HUCO-GS316]|uniref:hypothetical protein n=1 Tax=Streptomyces sp. HUCO-GS316 TaxID=2692198 RepID=UPI00136AA4A7|nr:hypothetical protein [Streptomyces sp. HUCO-GS316]MXM62996.1 hypothetical protein [Streptomyces sp. HUCO-GS316]
MGIRMLHRRTAPARAQAQSSTTATRSTPLPAFAIDASTARTPGGTRTRIRRFTTVNSAQMRCTRMIGRCRDYLARLVTRLPHPRRHRAPCTGHPRQ